MAVVGELDLIFYTCSIARWLDMFIDLMMNGRRSRETDFKETYGNPRD